MEQSPNSTIIRPDGTNETLTLPRTDPVGADWIEYIPDKLAPTFYKATSLVNTKTHVTTSGVVVSRRYYTPDYTATTNLTVQQEPTGSWIETPLPTDYWNRPLNSANHEWYVLAGNWLGGSAQNYPQGTAGQTSNYVGGAGPETPHILWTKHYYMVV